MLVEVALNAFDFFSIRVFFVINELKRPVDVSPLQVASVVPKHHAVWVRDRYYPKLEMFPQIVRLDRQERVDQSVDNERGVRLPRVLPPEDEDYRFLLNQRGGGAVRYF